MAFGFRGDCPKLCIRDSQVFISIAGHFWDLSYGLHEVGHSEFSAFIPAKPVMLEIVREDSSNIICSGIICDLTSKFTPAVHHLLIRGCIH